MKHRNNSKRSKSSNIVQLQRTWPKLQARPFPPHIQHNSDITPVQNQAELDRASQPNPQYPETITAAAEELQMQEEAEAVKQEVAEEKAVQKQESEEQLEEKIVQKQENTPEIELDQKQKVSI
jgi:hypothetical protein